jgi:hypothetical protein
MAIDDSWFRDACARCLIANGAKLRNLLILLVFFDVVDVGRYSSRDCGVRDRACPLGHIAAHHST